MGKRLMETNPYLDIKVIETGKLVPFDTQEDPNTPVEYLNRELNNLMKQTVEEDLKAKDEFQRVTNEKLKHAIEDAKNGKTRDPELSLGSIRTMKSKMKKMESDLEYLKNSIKEETEYYDKTFTDLEKDEATKKLDALKLE
jgi:predicted phage-related endonuclease